MICEMMYGYCMKLLNMCSRTTNMFTLPLCGFITILPDEWTSSWRTSKAASILSALDVYYAMGLDV
jgi:hypothetical protein